MANHRIVYMPDGPSGAGRLSLSPAGESDNAARVRAQETRDGNGRMWRVAREGRVRGVRPETAERTLLGPTGAGKLGSRGPRDAADRAAKVTARAVASAAHAADTQRALRARPGTVASDVADAAMLTRAERRALRKAAFLARKRAEALASAESRDARTVAIERRAFDCAARVIARRILDAVCNRWNAGRPGPALPENGAIL